MNTGILCNAYKLIRWLVTPVILPKSNVVNTMCQIKNSIWLDLLTGNKASNVSQAACRTGRVGYIGPPGAVKEYNAVFNRVLVVARNSTPAKS